MSKPERQAHTFPRVLIALLLLTGCNSAHSPQPAGSPREVIAKYCVTCHGPGGQASEFDWTNQHSVEVHRQGIGAKVRLHSMPPPGMPQPDEDERRVILCWVDPKGARCAG